MARDLNALFKITSILNSIRDLQELQQRLLELLGEVIPPTQGRYSFCVMPMKNPVRVAYGTGTAAIRS